MFSQCSKCSAFGNGPVFYLQKYTGWKDFQLHMCAAREFPCQNFHIWSCCKYQTDFDEGMPKGRMKRRKFGCNLAIRDAAVKWGLQISFDHLLLWCALNAHISVSNSAATAGSWTHNLAECTVYMTIHATVLNISCGALWPYHYVVPLLVNNIYRKDAKMLRRKAACSYVLHAVLVKCCKIWYCFIWLIFDASQEVWVCNKWSLWNSSKGNWGLDFLLVTATPSQRQWSQRKHRFLLASMSFDFLRLVTTPVP